MMALRFFSFIFVVKKKMSDPLQYSDLIFKFVPSLHLLEDIIECV